MGTHPSGPATVVGNDKALTLKEWIEEHLEALGDRVVSQFGADLPFLFKVLSVHTALSIQSHPDKSLAERLHAQRPDVYKDGNHKPEMAIAITDDFTALCGFVPQEELVNALASVPELAEVVGAGKVAALSAAATEAERKAALKASFTALMTADVDKVVTNLEKMVTRLIDEKKLRKLTPKEELVLTLNEQYPKDVGVLSALFLNLVALKADQAIYLAANEPHAYISGQLVECMATSDNVIRAGLTPKLRDTTVLCESLTYNQGLPEVLAGDQVQEYITLYSPPFEEFEVFRSSLPAGASTLVPGNQGPTLVLVQRGEGTVTASARLGNDALQADVTVHKGDVYFVPAQTPLQLSANGEPLLLWVAAVNSRVFADTFKLPAKLPAEAPALALASA